MTFIIWKKLFSKYLIVFYIFFFCAAFSPYGLPVTESEKYK